MAVYQWGSLWSPWWNLSASCCSFQSCPSSSGLSPAWSSPGSSHPVSERLYPGAGHRKPTCQESRLIRRHAVTLTVHHAVFQDLSCHILQILVGRFQAVGDIVGEILCCHGGTRCPTASLSSTYAIALVVTATGATALAVWACAIGAGIGVATAYLEGAECYQSHMNMK